MTLQIAEKCFTFKDGVFNAYDINGENPTDLLAPATTTTKGLMSASDKVKLDSTNIQTYLGDIDELFTPGAYLIPEYMSGDPGGEVSNYSILYMLKHPVDDSLQQLMTLLSSKQPKRVVLELEKWRTTEEDWLTYSSLNGGWEYIDYAEKAKTLGATPTVVLTYRAKKYR